jgi:hypothetical protein
LKKSLISNWILKRVHARTRKNFMAFDKEKMKFSLKRTLNHNFVQFFKLFELKSTKNMTFSRFSTAKRRFLKFEKKNIQLKFLEILSKFSLHVMMKFKNSEILVIILAHKDCEYVNLVQSKQMGFANKQRKNT